MPKRKKFPVAANQPRNQGDRSATRDAERLSSGEATETVPASGEGMLPMVALGGSAGSIGALQKFFAAMPVDSGMAFVVVLHLSPDYKSTLAAMFQRSTTMPVVTARDGAAARRWRRTAYM